MTLDVPHEPFEQKELARCTPLPAGLAWSLACLCSPVRLSCALLGPVPVALWRVVLLFVACLIVLQGSESKAASRPCTVMFPRLLDTLCSACQGCLGVLQGPESEAA